MSRNNADQPEGIVRFRLGGNPHFIQARKAWEDEDTWVAGVAIAKSDGVVDVVFPPDGEEPPIGRPVWITERWGVLAVVDAEGNAIAVKDLDDIPRSVFGLAGADRLMFNAVKRIEEAEQEPIEELAYATITGLDGIERFSIVRRADAEYSAQIITVINECSTWGEVREMATAEQYDDLLGRAGYGTIDEYLQDLDVGRPIPGAAELGAEKFAELGNAGPPADDEPFDPNTVEGLQSGDFPPMTDYLQAELLPKDLADEYGRRYETVFNGTFLELPPESGPPIVKAMEKLGYRCVELPELFHAELYRFEWMI